MHRPLRFAAIAVAACLTGAALAPAAHTQQNMSRSRRNNRNVEATFTASTNPVFRGADPHADILGGRVWVYPTWGFNGFYAFSTPDLRHWERTGPVLDFADVTWLKDGGYQHTYPWAPALAERDGKFYFYFSIGPQSHNLPARIGVGVGDSPAGPFKDSGKPLLTGGNGFEAIDPMVFRDPKSGKYYFYAGGSAGATLRAFEMNPDMVSFRREIKVDNPPYFTEGVFMHERNGVYHLTYSHGSYMNSSYSVHHATSSSPTGPWKYRGVILKSDATHKGPGHHSIIRHPNRDEWFIIYHRWNDRADNGPYHGDREVAIDRLTHGPGGEILPVRMTDTLPVLNLKPAAPEQKPEE